MSNKSDFEKALGELENKLDLLEGVLDSELVSIIDSVVSEYNLHYLKDIEELIDENEKLKNEN